MAKQTKMTLYWLQLHGFIVTRGVNKGRLPAFAGGNILLAGGKISDRPVEISILANILLRLQFHLIYLAKKGILDCISCVGF